MNGVGEIIVYRNPVEKMVWDGVMNGNFMPIVFGMVAFFIIFLVSYKLLEKYAFTYFMKRYNSARHKGARDTIARISLTLGGLAMAATIYYTWI